MLKVLHASVHQHAGKYWTDTWEMLEHTICIKMSLRILHWGERASNHRPKNFVFAI